MTALAPLTDITNLRRVQSNIQQGCNQPSPVMSRASMESSSTAAGLSPEHFSPLSTASQLNASSPNFEFAAPQTPVFTMPASRPSVTRHDPYNWKCLPENDQQATMLLAQRASRFAQTQMRRKSSIHMHCAQPQPQVQVQPQVQQPQLQSNDSLAMSMSGSMTQAPAAQHQQGMHPIQLELAAAAAAMANQVQGPTVCRILVQFKCHHGEFASSISLEKGQYVVVQGDRGMDIGVVIRVNSDAQKTYIERTGPCGSVMRHATQREVDYWATDLKADEQTALDFCKRRVVQLDINMEVRHAEYQFDKKKLTFYYDAKARVDFVSLLKDLYREFGCRIWMEKVRPAE